MGRSAVTTVMTKRSSTCASTTSAIGWTRSWGTTMASEVQATVEQAWEQRDTLGPRTGGAIRDAVDAAIAALDSGEARIAERQGGDWVVHQWLKKAVLLSFRLNPMESIA